MSKYLQAVQELADIEKEIAADKVQNAATEPEVLARIDELAEQEIDGMLACAAMAIELKEDHAHLKRLIDEAKIMLAHIKEREESYRARLSHRMELNDTRKLKSPDGLFTASLVDGKGSLDIFDEASIPDRYKIEKQIIELEIDKGAIRAAIESGLDVPGARIVREPFVQLRVNPEKMLEYRLQKATHTMQLT